MRLQHIKEVLEGRPDIIVHEQIKESVSELHDASQQERRSWESTDERLLIGEGDCELLRAEECRLKR
jgi:hypothetical protein